MVQKYSIFFYYIGDKTPKGGSWTKKKPSGEFLYLLFTVTRLKIGLIQKCEKTTLVLQKTASPALGGPNVKKRVFRKKNRDFFDKFIIKNVQNELFYNNFVAKVHILYIFVEK